MIYKAFDKQIEFHQSSARIRGGFAGKRCINPQSRVLTPDGLKSFGDIVRKDRVLSFHQKANQFRFSPCGDAFPKTKETGYRVIHDQGEFVSSAHHRVLLASGDYVSVQEIYDAFQIGPNVQGLSFLCPDQSTLELAHKAFLSDDLRLSRKPLGSLDHCEICTHQYDLQPRKALNTFQSLSQQIFCALGLKQFGVCHASFSHLDGLSRTILGYNHPDPFYVLNAIEGDRGRAGIQAFFSQVLSEYGHIFSRSRRLFQEVRRQSLNSCAQHTSPEFEQLQNEAEKVFALKSHIRAIERVSTQWFWDVEVPGDNNYLSEGAVHHNSGKTECGAIESIIHTESQRGWDHNQIDPYAGAIIAPTTDMLRRLSLKKFLSYAKPFKFRHHQTFNEIEWHNGSMVYGISGDKPARLEGLKLNWIWIDEVFQCSEQLFLECRARVADQRGNIWVTGSLGVQYQNPRRHWVYKYFKENKPDNVATFEWATSDNPYFPQDELADLKDTLDPRTFRQMFTIDWNTPGSALVYDNFSELNYIKGFVLDPSRHEVSVSIDWGWNHELACLFVAYDIQRDTVTVFDEIISSRMTLDQLYARIMAKQYPIANWFCDIAGNQEREQTGKSNVQWFREKGIQMRYRQTAVNFGVALVRTYIRTGSGIIKLYIDELRCPKTVDGMLNYSYPTKDGQIVNENPLKVADDAMDSLRYYFVNRLDKAIQQTEVKQFNRWGEWKF